MPFYIVASREHGVFLFWVFWVVVGGLGGVVGVFFFRFGGCHLPLVLTATSGVVAGDARGERLLVRP